jgi:hypothetical protein
MPPEGTPSAVHNRMANMVPYFIIYFNNSIVFRHTGFETRHLEGYIDVCMSDYLQQLESLEPPLPMPTPPTQPPSSEADARSASIQYYLPTS